MTQAPRAMKGGRMTSRAILALLLVLRNVSVALCRPSGRVLAVALIVAVTVLFAPAA